MGNQSIAEIKPERFKVVGYDDRDERSAKFEWVGLDSVVTRNWPGGRYSGFGWQYKETLRIYARDEL